MRALVGLAAGPGRALLLTEDAALRLGQRARDVHPQLAGQVGQARDGHAHLLELLKLRVDKRDVSGSQAVAQIGQARGQLACAVGL